MLEHGRKIATILAADVAEYSRLMGVDEAGTLAALNIRRALFQQLVREHEGHEFGSVGDSLMAQFPSAVNAVHCAQAIQHAVEKENELLPPERRMALRIGLNLGDVIEEKGTLFGDGVNVAARLQALAAPGGILISASVYDHVKKKLPGRLSYAGARRIKNIADPVPAYEVLDADERRYSLKTLIRYPHRWRVAVITVLAFLVAGAMWYWRDEIEWRGLQPATRAAISAEPSVAVLPFLNMSSEPDNEPFADGLSEEVLNVLAGIEGLKVAGRTSSFYFKGKSEKPEVIATTLGVTHLLEGSVRWSGPTVRITAQLIDASNGFHLWSETFDREITDVFAVQEEIARAVAGALRVRLLPADEAHLARRGTQSSEAHRLYLVARGRVRERDLANLRAAKALFEDAIKRDPLYANAYSGLADAIYLLIRNHDEETQHGEQLGERAADRAAELDPASSEAHASRANFALLRYQVHGDVTGFERAIADYQRAIKLDPSNAEGHYWYGRAIQDKDPDRALRLFERAVELDPLMRQAQLAAAHAFAYRGQYDKARKQFKEVIDRYPDFAGAYREASLVEWGYGHLVDARSGYSKAYELDADPTSALWVFQTSLDLGDRVTAAEWLPRIAGNRFLELVIAAAELGIDGKYPQALESHVLLLEQGFDNERFVVPTAHLAMIIGQPERATAILLKRFPELVKDENRIEPLKCNAAIALAASWQRTNRRSEADHLLRRTAIWLDSPQAPRWPTRHIVRAQVHALLGEEDQAFDALNHGFDEGYRGALATSLLGGFYGFFYRGEDNPLFDNVRSDPRFTAWFARLHADNARQLAQLKSQGASDQ